MLAIERICTLRPLDTPRARPFEDQIIKQDRIYAVKWGMGSRQHRPEKLHTLRSILDFRTDRATTGSPDSAERIRRLAEKLREIDRRIDALANRTEDSSKCFVVNIADIG